MPSVYCPELTTDLKLLTLRGEEFHHLARVARARTGDTIKLNNGKGLLAWAKVTEIRKDELGLLVETIQSQHEFPAPFAIAFSILKNRHDELLVEKCTELGAQRFFPLVSDFTVRKGGLEAVKRLNRIALAAIKQCDNPWLPVVEHPQGLAPVLLTIREMGYTPVLCSEQLPHQWITDLPPDPRMLPCFIIGPEGGWSDREMELFEREQVRQISIGYLITRAETAAITAAAQWVAYANKLRATGTK